MRAEGGGGATVRALPEVRDARYTAQKRGKVAPNARLDGNGIILRCIRFITQASLLVYRLSCHVTDNRRT